MNKLLTTTVLLGSLLFGAGAHAEPQIAAAEDSDQPAAPSGEHVHHWFAASAGLRNVWLLDSSFDPYAGDDRMSELAVGFDVRPLQLGPVGLALSAEYDMGGRNGRLRSAHTSIDLHRLAVGVEASVELWRLQLFARGTPSAYYADAKVDDPSFSRDLEAGGWTWGVDATGGFRFRLGSAGPGDAPVARFWLLAEAGYAFAGKIDMSLTPAADSEDPQAYGSVMLPDFRPRGVVNRIAFVVSF